MASVLTRRNFLKCAGVAVLAVTASGIFTGCGESGGSGSGAVGVNETVTAPNGVKIKLLGYQQDPIAGMVANYNDKTSIAICFSIDNQSENSIQMGNTAQDKIKDVLEAIYYNKYENLAKSDFVVAANGANLVHADIGYKAINTGSLTDLLGYGFLGTLEPKKSGVIKVFALVPSNWEQIGIQYTPYFAKDKTFNFVLNKANKI